MCEREVAQNETKKGVRAFVLSPSLCALVFSPSHTHPSAHRGGELCEVRGYNIFSYCRMTHLQGRGALLGSWIRARPTPTGPCLRGSSRWTALSKPSSPLAGYTHKETYICGKRDLHMWQKRPTYVTALSAPSSTLAPRRSLSPTHPMPV